MHFSKKDMQKIFSSALFLQVNRDAALEIFDKHACFAQVFESGAIIHSPECTQRRVGLVLYGEAAVTTNDPSKGALLRFLRVGDFFGIANLFNESPFVSTIRAQKPCRVFF